MKILVAYYSRTGNTEKVAQALAAELGAEAATEKITEARSRDGFFGFLGAGMDATFQRSTPIEPPRTDLAAYDLVVVGTPIWAFTLTPPVRTFLESSAGKLKAAAFFCTEGNSGHVRAFRAMEKLSGRKPVAVLALTEKEVHADFSARVKDFARALRAVPQKAGG
jgi:flavodoxin